MDHVLGHNELRQQEAGNADVGEEDAIGVGEKPGDQTAVLRNERREHILGVSPRTDDCIGGQNLRQLSLEERVRIVEQRREQIELVAACDDVTEDLVDVGVAARVRERAAWQRNLSPAQQCRRS